MSSAISEYLPMAFGVALSPIPIIAMIVLCVIGKAKTEGTLFALGWFVSIIAVMLVVVLLGSSAGAGSESDPSTWSIILQFGLAFLLLFLSWNNWRQRPKHGEEIKEPGWIGKLSTMSGIMVFALALAIAFTNAKNLPIEASAAITIAQAHHEWIGGLADAAIFAFVGTLGVLTPWFISIVGGEKMTPVLENMRDWLYKYNNIIMTLLFGFLGVNALGSALALLS